MEASKALICISCPMGCRLTVREEPNGAWLIEGNGCKRGEEYAVKELTNPTRVLTTTVELLNGSLKRLPVRTEEAIPKQLLFEAMRAINEITVEAPIIMGDIILSNLLDTGVNVIASKSMNRCNRTNIRSKL